MALVIDFVADATAILRDHLTNLGYQLPPGLTGQDVRLRYFNVLHRLIPKQPRTVHKASGFQCPIQVQAGLDLLERKLANGDDLRPHLSRGLLNSEYSDALLNDWGIYHFHLGTTIEPNGFIGRTGPLLFARVTANDAYFIDIRSHGGWSSLSLLKTVHANWPASLERFRIRGVVGLAYAPGEGPPTDAEIGEMRQANINVMHELAPGQVYIPAGGGYATDGTSISVVDTNDAFVKRVRDVEVAVRSFEEELRTKLQREANEVVPDPLTVRLLRRSTGDLVADFSGVAVVPVGTLSLI